MSFNVICAGISTLARCVFHKHWAREIFLQRPDTILAEIYSSTFCFLALRIVTLTLRINYVMDFVAFLKSPVNMSHKHLSNSAKVIIVVVVNISIQFSPRLEFKEF